MASGGNLSSCFLSAPALACGEVSCLPSSRALTEGTFTDQTKPEDTTEKQGETQTKALTMSGVSTQAFCLLTSLGPERPGGSPVRFLPVGPLLHVRVPYISHTFLVYLTAIIEHKNAKIKLLRKKGCVSCVAADRWMDVVEERGRQTGALKTAKGQASVARPRRGRKMDAGLIFIQDISA